MTNLKILIAIILICALLSSPKAAFAQAADLGVFNPSKVDWWVSMDDSIISNQQNCEVHWLFDDSLDVSLSVSDAYRLFFTFRVRPEGKEVTPPLQLRKGMADKASLMVEDVSHPLGITEIDVHPAMVVMGIPDLLNNLSYVKDANRLLLNLDNTVYNFPLENMDENIEYFEKCLESVDPGALAKIQNSSAQPYTPAPADGGTDTPYDYAVEIEPLESEEPEISFANPPIEEAAPETIDVATAEEAEMAEEGDPNQRVLPNGKQTDDMLADMKYDGVSDKTPEELEEAEPEEEKIGQIVKNKRESTDSCSGSAFDERGTAIINNLTAKLAVLEREKEELRAKTIGSSGHKAIVDILECGSQSLEPEDDTVNEDILARFEITIENLRAENELLKEALEKAEANDTDALQNELSEVQAELKSVIERNYELQDELFNYQLEEKEAAEAEEAGQDEVEEEAVEQIDLIEQIILDNNLGNVMPQTPSTGESGTGDASGEGSEANIGSEDASTGESDAESTSESGEESQSEPESAEN